MLSLARERLAERRPMTGTERLTAAIGGKPADRVPIFCNLLDQGAREMGVSLRDYYADPECVAEAQLLLRRRYDYDSVWCLFYVGKEAEYFGSREFLFAEDGPPNVADYVIKSFDDIERLEVPDVEHHPAFQATRTCLRRLRAEVGGRYPICVYVTSSFSLPSLLMGMEKWLELLFLGPPRLRDLLLEKCSLFFQRHAMAHRAEGGDVFVYSTAFASPDFLSPPRIRTLVRPWIVRDLAPVGMDGMVFFCGGARLGSSIDLAAELGFGAFYLSPLEDVAEGKRRVAGRGLTCGIIEDLKMVRWSPDEVRAEVRRIMAAGTPGGQFAFGTMAMPLAIPEANIRALMEAAIEHGQPRSEGKA